MARNSKAIRAAGLEQACGRNSSRTASTQLACEGKCWAVVLREAKKKRLIQ